MSNKPCLCVQISGLDHRGKHLFVIHLFEYSKNYLLLMINKPLNLNNIFLVRTLLEALIDFVFGWLINYKFNFYTDLPKEYICHVSASNQVSPRKKEEALILSQETGNRVYSMSLRFLSYYSYILFDHRRETVERLQNKESFEILDLVCMCVSARARARACVI